MWAADNLQASLYLLVYDCVSYHGSLSPPSLLVLFCFVWPPPNSLWQVHLDGGLRSGADGLSVGTVVDCSFACKQERIFLSPCQLMDSSRAQVHEAASLWLSSRHVVAKTVFMIKRRTNLEDAE